MYIKIINFILLLSILVINKSQSQYTIRGNVFYHNKNLDFVTIKLIKERSLLESAISDNKGLYKIDVKNKGLYTLTFYRIGFKKFDTTLLIDKNIELSPKLYEEIKELKSITIYSNLPEIRQKANGYEFEIEKTSLERGNNMNDILPLLPGVIDDGEGNISLNNGTVLVMIDNRELKLSGIQLKLFLNSIRSDNIKRIDVITYPSAAYDAEGIGGVIKIVTKKKVDESYSGSFSEKYMQGTYSKNEISANGILNLDKLIAYVGLSEILNNNYSSINNIRNNSQFNYFQENNIFLKNRLMLYSTNCGLNYNINKNNSLSLDINYTSSNTKIRDNKSMMDTRIYYNDILDTLLLSYIPMLSRSKTFSISTNYQLCTDKIGSNLKVSADYLVPTSHSYNGFYNAYFSPNHLFIDSIINDNLIDKDFNIASIKVDRHKVLKFKTTKLDYGLKFVNANTSVDNFYRNYNGGHWNSDSTLTNSLKYDERIFAGYISSDIQIGKLQATVGVRSEYTKYNVISDNIYCNHYLKIFPNLSILFPLNKNRTVFIGFHYNKRINRPSYEILNPFIYKIDQYTLKEGNPFLSPAINNKISTTINYKNNYTITFSYESEKNTFGEIQKPRGNFTLQTFDNINKKNEFDLLTTANFNITKYGIMIWQVMLYNKKYTTTNYSVKNIGTLISNVNIAKFSSSLDVRLTNQFFTKGPDRFTSINRNFFFSSLDFNKTTLKGRLQIRFGINDIFNARGHTSISYQYLTLSNSSIIIRDSRYLYFGIIYNFSNGKTVRKTEIQKSNVDEEQRTK